MVPGIESGSPACKVCVQPIELYLIFPRRTFIFILQMRSLRQGFASNSSETINLLYCTQEKDDLVVMEHREKES